ncbi:MAG: hypothetical protein GEV09_11065 [Pseudonocardiaceae bacterium]|nr:hypothetical protein [Pseudonocardiaceae bacterium]
MPETRIRLSSPTDPAHPIEIGVPGERSVCPGLVITPCCSCDEQGRPVLRDGWQITHEPTGLRLTDRVFGELLDAVIFTEVLAGHEIDFTDPHIGAHPAVLGALQATAAVVEGWMTGHRPVALTGCLTSHVREETRT